MSNDKIRPLIKAFADLPTCYTGLILDVVNQLRSDDAPYCANEIKKILELIRAAKLPKQVQPKTLADLYKTFTPEHKAKRFVENGCLYFAVEGVGIKANLWGDRLKSGGHELSKWAKDVLSKPDYDKNHRLEAGKIYKLGLVFGKEITDDSKRSTSALQDLGRHKFGPQANEGLKGEFALLIREKFSNAELEAMELKYIAVLHKPITDSDGNPVVLSSDRYDGSCVDAFYASPDDPWDDYGAFASLAS